MGRDEADVARSSPHRHATLPQHRIQVSILEAQGGRGIEASSWAAVGPVERDRRKRIPDRAGLGRDWTAQRPSPSLPTPTPTPGPLPSQSLRLPHCGRNLRCLSRFVWFLMHFIDSSTSSAVNEGIFSWTPMYPRSIGDSVHITMPMGGTAIQRGR